MQDYKQCAENKKSPHWPRCCWSPDQQQRGDQQQLKKQIICKTPKWLKKFSRYMSCFINVKRH